MRVGFAVILAALAVPAVAPAGTVFLLDGRGWGHGVGMSQWGAEGYARHGFGYRQILAHYYPQTTIEQGNPRPVRVLLSQGRDAVRIGSAAPFVVLDARGRKLHLPARSVVIDRTFTLRHTSVAAPSLPAGGTAAAGRLRGYRGDVVVKRKPGGLMVVNLLPLDRYLRGVVPWEVPKGWHEATYEAQAVAARSYTLATLKPGKDFDLFPDTRWQMYGGISAERPQTNLAVGATAGEVLGWDGRTIAAFYFSTSGGRTSSIHDAWPKALRCRTSCRWRIRTTTSRPITSGRPRCSARAASGRGWVRGVRDAIVVRNSSGRAQAVRLLTAHGWKRVAAQRMRTTFKLGSTDFELRALTLEPPAVRVLFGTHTRVQGWVRGLGKARLQRLGERGWQTIAPIHAGPNGHFTVSVRALRSTQLRLAYNGLAGDAVPLTVTPRVTLRADGRTLRVLVSPRLPLQVQRLTQNAWRPVARTTGSFKRSLKPGSYRVKVLGGVGYTPAVSRSVGVH